MRKQNSLKLLLCAMLMAIGTNVWGALNNSTVTHNDQKFLDVVAVTASNGDEVTVSGQYAAYTVSELVSNSIKGVWYSQVSSSGGSNESSAVTATGFRSSNSKYMSVTSTNTVTFYVKGCVGVAVLYDPRASGADRKYIVTATNVDDETDEVTITDTQATSSDNQYVVALSDLSASKYYKVVVKTGNTQGSRMFQFRVESATTTPSISASDVDLAYNVTSGEIAYSLKNATVGVNPTAEITSGSDWVSNMQLDTENGKISFAATENTVHAKRTATIKISYTGAVDKVVKITQGAAPISEIITVDSETNWDFTNSVVDGVTEIKFSEKDVEEILGNKDGWKETFLADAMKGRGEYMYSSTRNKTFQGSTLIIKPAVSGTVTVKWGSTGTNARTLRINDVIMDNEGSSSSAAANAKTSTIMVPAGKEVVIKGMEKGTDGNWNLNKDGYLRIYSVSFTPAVLPYADQTISMVVFDESNNYWATYSSDKVTFISDDATVYKANISGDALNLVELDKVTEDIPEYGDVEGYWVPANTGVLLKSTVSTGNVTSWTVDNMAITALTNNDLRAASVAKEAEGYKFYMLAYASEALDNLGFYWGAPEGAAFESRVGSAYLAIPNSVPAPARFVLSDLNDKVPTAVENSSLNTEVKKVVIDGQMMILRDGNLFDLNGRLVK